MLRYYDEMSLLKPEKVDQNTGYRFYSVEQIPRLLKIVFLRDAGFKVAEIAAAIDNWNDNTIAELLNHKRQEIESDIASHQQRIARIDNALTNLHREKDLIRCNISIKNIPGFRVLSLRRIIDNYFGEGDLWKELSLFTKNNNIELRPTGNNFAIYHDLECKDCDVDVEVCVAIDNSVNIADAETNIGFACRLTEAVPTAACAMVYGPFENIAGSYHSLAHWLTGHEQYKMTGKSRQICHRGPWNEADSEKFLTEIQIPIEHRHNT